MADPTEAEEVEGEEEQAPKRNWRRELEDRAKTAEEKAAQLQRELAFTKAGLDHLSDRQAVALYKVHDGDMTAEALKATADELFGAKSEPGESTPGSEGPDHSAEASELAALARSPAGEAPSGAPLSQEQIDQKLAEVVAEGGPDAAKDWMLANRSLFDF